MIAHRPKPHRATKTKYCYDHPRPAVTVDVVLLCRRPLEVLLIKRGRPPFKGSWALPGGFVDKAESLEAAAARELLEETGIDGIQLKQIGAFGGPGRDPRGHTISVAYVLQSTGGRPRAGTDAAATAGL